jgi:AAA domain
MPPKIAVVGTSGSGKTTVARELARRLGVPHVELDALYHGPRTRRHRGLARPAAARGARARDAADDPPDPHRRGALERQPRELARRLPRLGVDVRLDDPQPPPAPANAGWTARAPPRPPGRPAPNGAGGGALPQRSVKLWPEVPGRRAGPPARASAGRAGLRPSGSGPPGDGAIRGGLIAAQALRRRSSSSCRGRS